MQKQIDNLYAQLVQVENIIKESQLQYKEYNICFPNLEPGDVYNYFLKKVTVVIQRYARRHLAMKKLKYMKYLIENGPVLRQAGPFYNTNYEILSRNKCPRSHKALYLIYTSLQKLRLNCYYNYKNRIEKILDGKIKRKQKSNNVSKIKQLHDLKQELCYDLSSD